MWGAVTLIQTRLTLLPDWEGRDEQLDAILLTYTHIDHTGYLPRLVWQGYWGPVYATDPP